MSLCSLIYNNTQGISSANDLIQIMNIGNQFYSTLSWLARQTFLKQSELPKVLNVSNAVGYQLEYSENYSGTVHQETAVYTVPFYKEPLSCSYLKTTPIS